MTFNKSSGQASRLLLILTIVVLVAAVITYLIIKMAEKPPKPKEPVNTSEPQPVYEATLGNIKFIFEAAIDKGAVLKAADVTNSVYSSYQKNLTTTEKFIEVQVGTQNVGKENIEQNSWDIGNIVDSEGREFVPVESYSISPWLPNPDLCGTLLKPAFDPTPCIKIYEVSKKSTGLKIRVATGVDNTANNFSGKKVNAQLLDLIVK